MTMLARVAWLFVAILLVAPQVRAEEAENSKRAAAKELGQEAIQDFEDGDYEEALDKFQRAYTSVKAPSLGRWTALTLIKLGRLVEAAQRYLDVTRLPVNVGDSELQLEAKRASAKERTELLARIPRLRVRVGGIAPDDVEVKVNGTSWSEARLGEEQLVNPGDYEAVGKSSEETVAKTTTLVEGDTKELILQFHPVAGASGAPRAASRKKAAVPEAAADESAPTEPMQDEGSGAWSGAALRSKAMWAALGVGVVGLGVGAATGVMLMPRKRDLENGDCLGGACGPIEHDKVDEYNRLRTISSAGFIVGGVFSAVGVGLLLAGGGDHESKAQSGVHPWLGLGAAGVAGSF